jgi:hypothetical protein
MKHSSRVRSQRCNEFVYCHMLSRLACYNAIVIDNKLSEYFAAMGRKSAKARMKKLSAKRRREIASNAAKSRWAKRRKRKPRKR